MLKRFMFASLAFIGLIVPGAFALALLAAPAARPEPLQQAGCDRSLVDAAAGIAVVVSGHSHRPVIHRRQGVLYVNPGSCGPRRFDLPVTLALLHVSAKGVDAELVPLRVESAHR